MEVIFLFSLELNFISFKQNKHFLKRDNLNPQSNDAYTEKLCINFAIVLLGDIPSK